MQDLIIPAAYMNKGKIVVLAILSGIWLSSCGDGNPPSTMYVVTPRERAALFSDDLAAITRTHGLVPNQGRSTDDRGHTYWVTEAKTMWVRLWSTNMPLSGQESSSKCGRFTEGHPDPGQYIVTVSPRVPLLFDKYAGSVMKEISRDLEKAGYILLTTPIECSDLSKEQGEKGN